ncbi:hypothetical protein FQA39_LY13078 [Lamprigera yunnana]|nr:hypothetical protein FQA39_LY13078 [Lamprigera yunnana]
MKDIKWKSFSHRDLVLATTRIDWASYLHEMYDVILTNNGDMVIDGFYEMVEIDESHTRAQKQVDQEWKGYQIIQLEKQEQTASVVWTCVKDARNKNTKTSSAMEAGRKEKAREAEKNHEKWHQQKNKERRIEKRPARCGD